MKILHIITGLEQGGAENLLANFCNIHALEHEIHIIYLKGKPVVASRFAKNINILHIPVNFKTASHIRKYVIDHTIEIVHTHLGHADFIGLWAIRGLNVKPFCTMHNIWYKFNFMDQLIFKVYTFLFTRVVKNCKVICISKVVKEHVLKTLRVPEERIRLIYNGIPARKIFLSKNEIRKQLEWSDDILHILFVGRLEKQKSVHTLIRAMGEVVKSKPDIMCNIVGEGSLKKELEDLSISLRLEKNIRFLGTTDQVEMLLSGSDLFVLPSVFEGLGIVILEAFRSGTAVVASNVEGPAELIEDGISGRLFPAGNSMALSKIIIELTLNPAKREMIARQGLSTFSDHFLIDKYARNLLNLYEE